MKRIVTKMPKNAKAQSAKTNSATARSHKIFLTIITIVILIGGISFGVLYGWRAYRIHQEKPRFAQVEHDIQQAYRNVIHITGAPADAAYIHFCDRPNSEAFEDLKPLTCFMDQYFVYNTYDVTLAERLAATIAAAMHKNKAFIMNRPLPEKSLLFTDDQPMTSSLRNSAIEGYMDTSVGSFFDCTVSYGYHDRNSLQQQMPLVYSHVKNVTTQRVLLVDLGCEAGASREYYPSKNN